MENRFDELSKLLATRLPRREALRHMGSLLAGAFLGLFGLGKKAAAADLCVSACQALGCNRVASLYVNCVLNCRKFGVGALCGCGVCPAGLVCQGGNCVIPVCPGGGGVCGTFVFGCRNNCLCVKGAEGQAVCANDRFCDVALPCTTSANCPAGQVCWIDNCCGFSICTSPCTLTTPQFAPAAALPGKKASGK